MASLQKKTDENRWRVRWRDGGRGSAALATKWFKTKKEATAELQRREAVAGARKSACALIPLPELVERWVIMQSERRQPRSPRYIAESRTTLLRVIGEHKWHFSSDVGELDVGPGAFRLLRALLLFGKRRHAQPVLELALVAPDRQRAKRAPTPLPSLEDVLHLIAEATTWGTGSGVIAHLVAVYGHRPQSLVDLTRGSVDRSFVGLTPAEAPPGQGFLTLPVKGGRVVRHPLLPASLALLEPLLVVRPAGAPLFLHHTQRPGEPPRPWKHGQEWSSWFHHSVGKGRGIYRLKTWAITFMHAGGIDIPTICSITGHSTDTVAGYLRSNEAMQGAAMAVIGRSGVAGP